VKEIAAIIWAAIHAGCSTHSPVEQTMTEKPSATIYYNATVITLDEAHPRATGLRIAGERITHVFDGVPPDGLSGERVDLTGAVVLPGLVDAHFHLRSIGTTARQLDLRGTESVEGVAELVAKEVAETPVGTWIRGRGWDQNDWEVKELPCARLLDEVAPEHPVWLSRIDGHAVWLNTRAMRLAGVDPGTLDPPGGELLRLPDGGLSGVFVDNAIDLVDDKLPEPTRAEVKADFIEGLKRCKAVGLTGGHDMGLEPIDVEVLRELEREGRLTMRLTGYLHGTVSALAPLLAEPPDREGLLRVVGVKLYADGALGSRGAALLEPYRDRPDTRGLLVTEAKDLAARVRTAHEAGYQVAIHAIGDRGNRVALDAIASGQGGDASRRHRIEHVQVVHDDDFARFIELGVVASMQPTHATSDMPWAEARLGADRMGGAYAGQRMLVLGVPLALGSDAPIESENPWLGIYAAITRQDAEGQPAGGWRPEQRLSPEAAIFGFTRGAAYASHDEDLGVIRPGALADLTVVAADPTEVEPAVLFGMETLLTIVGGRE